MRIEFYDKSKYEEWDEFINKSYNGTILHTRKFLSYHKERFMDKSLIVYDEKDKIIAVFPAAINPADNMEIVSHPGITYGGIITNKLYGVDIISILKEISVFYKNKGFKSLIYKSVPHIYHTKYSQDDLYALFRMNAQRNRCDLSATIKLNEDLKIRQATKRKIKKAQNNNIKIVCGVEYLPKYWEVLEENLENTYKAKPVHTLNEITDLFNRFENEMECIVALKNDEVIAGIILFNINRVCHAQYISNKNKQDNNGALELLFITAIENASKKGMEYFDFGTSNENQGKYLNHSLYQFKRGFNSGGVVYETYKIDLREENING